MRFLKKNGRVLLVVTLVVTALSLIGLMMVPQQGKKIGITSCAAAGYSCQCPEGYNDSDAYHDPGDCSLEYGKTEITCKTNRSCWNHEYDGYSFTWYSADCVGSKD